MLEDAPPQFFARAGVVKIFLDRDLHQLDDLLPFFTVGDDDDRERFRRLPRLVDLPHLGSDLPFAETEGKEVVGFGVELFVQPPERHGVDRVNVLFEVGLDG